MKIELKCINCEIKFEAEFKHRDKKYCCRKCYFEHANKTKLIGRKVDLSIREKRNCVVCNNEFEVKKTHDKKMCSDKCRKTWNSIEENKKERLDKSKEVVLQNHGVDSIFKKQIFKDNHKKLIFDKYGVDNPMKVKDFVDKLQENIKIKHVNKLLPKLKNNNLLLLDDYTVNKNKNTSLSYNFKCLTCDNVFSSTIMGSGKIPICRKCFPLIKNSKLEESIRDFLNKNNLKHLDNDRKILNGKEIDLLIEDSKIGIEIDGCYYHSELSGGKDKKYHINKTKLANEKDIKLIHIFEDEILYKNEIVLSRLSNLFHLNETKIYARKCEIREVNKKESKEFLNKNHIQGDSIDKIRLGLYYNNELVTLLTFGKLRKAMGSVSKDDHYELLRFCNKSYTNVIGSFSKLLKHFISNYKPLKILTYADIRWSGYNELETVYVKNGFKYIGNTPPNYWYLKVGEYNHRFHRFNYRKDILIKEGFDPKLTEFQIMQIKGYDRIWDCGNMKFELSFT